MHGEGTFQGLSDAEVQPVLDMLHGLTGITIPVQKKTMVLSRLRKHLAALRPRDFAEYLATVRRDSKEKQRFINLLTTNETSFFRTRRVWEYFQQEWLPGFYAERGGSVMRAWSAAASTGEEACSLAMSCQEFQTRHRDFRFQILATDVDTDVLAQAASGVFRETTMNRLRESNPDLLARYFSPMEGGAGRFDPVVYRSVRFAVHNLMESPSALMPQDIVFLRNVLIYFQESEKNKIIEGIGNCMEAGSILVLGESESLGRVTSLFSFVQPQIYRRNG